MELHSVLRYLRLLYEPQNLPLGTINFHTNFFSEIPYCHFKYSSAKGGS